MLRTGQLLAPLQGLCRSASTAGSHPTPGAVLPGTLASPRTGLAPAGCRELVARLRHPPPLLRGILGARAAGRTPHLEDKAPPETVTRFNPAFRTARDRSRRRRPPAAGQK